jgi:hypothetical protein
MPIEQPSIMTEPAKGNQAVANLAKRPSFAATCAAQAIGHITDYAECLSESPDGCRFRWPFGLAHLCHHPLRKQIIARTNARRHKTDHEPADTIIAA